MTIIELSHVIEHGMITYPGLPPPEVGAHLSYEESRGHYEEGTEFQITKVTMVGNTGTYLDAPIHRHRDGVDLAGLALERCVELNGSLVPSPSRGPIGPEALDGHTLAGRAVLFHTGHDTHWGTDAYFHDHPYLAPATVGRLVGAPAALVGIDSLNIDDTSGGARVAHTDLLKAGIPIVEHLTGLSVLPSEGFRFSAAPVRWAGATSFPVRAYAVVPE